MVSRPENHVTRRLPETIRENLCPDLTEDLLAYLERNNQPRCFDPSKESEAEHFKHAGKVELIAQLRAMHEQY